MDQNTTQTKGEMTFSTPSVLRDILIVASPIILLGIIGNVIGLSTLTGGAVINLGYVLSILFGSYILKAQNTSWEEIGLAKPNSWLKTILLGIAALIGAVVVFIAMQILAVVLLTSLGMPPAEIDQSRFNSIEGNMPLLILMVVLAWTTIAFGEELFYRAFFITRLTDHANMSATLAVLISGIIFGVVHFAEGVVGILSNGAFGVLFGWIYIRSGRNLWITVIGHALINTLRFVLLYTGAT